MLEQCGQKGLFGLDLDFICMLINSQEQEPLLGLVLTQGIIGFSKCCLKQYQNFRQLGYDLEIQQLVQLTGYSLSMPS